MKSDAVGQSLCGVAFMQIAEKVEKCQQKIR
jgi:hypothetical protein